MTGRYKAYPEYKDSGVEWLGEIPENWLATPVKFVGNLRGGAGFPHSEQGVQNQELDFHKVNALGSADSKGILGKSENTISYCTAKKLGAYIFPEDSIVFAKVGAALLLSRIRILNKKSCLDNNMMGLVINKDNSPAFIKYAMNVIRFDYLVNPGAIPSLNEFQVGNSMLAIPLELRDQEVITEFLDHETAKIDTLITKQEQLIELLKEKRQAVISHAVTKGLNPDAPMKDSGVEWLGQVPEHWNVAALKRFIHKMEQGRSPECESTPASIEQWGVLKTSCVNNAVFNVNENKELPEHIEPHYQYEVKAGDILMSRASGSIKLIGSVARVQSDVRDKILLSDKVFRIVLTKNIDADFFVLLMASDYMRTLIENAISGADGMANNITKSSITSFVIPVPAVGEQQSIVDKINLDQEVLAKLNTSAVKALELLKERKTALISAAVTGKIDVRHPASHPAGNDTVETSV